MEASTSVCWVKKRERNKLIQVSWCLQESGMTLITAEDLDDAAEKAVKASTSWVLQISMILLLDMKIFVNALPKIIRRLLPADV